MSFLVAGVLCADLVLIIVTGGMSLLTPWVAPTPATFALREGLLAVALVARLGFLAPLERRLSGGRLMLLLSVLPCLFHLHFLGRRISADGLYYYVFTRSMVRDADVDFTNEYDHYGLLTRDDHSVPTPTGHRRTTFPIGPGISWTPFFLAADALGSVLNRGGLDVDMSGYGKLHVNAVGLGSLAYGVAALFVILALVRKHFPRGPATAAVFLLWWASFLPWYLAEQPINSHTASLLLTAVFFLMREKLWLATPLRSLVFGLVLGAAMCVRWQNGVYLLLPAADLFVLWRRGEPLGAIVRRGLAMGGGVFVGALPQFLAWKAIFDEYVLLYPPQGLDYVRFDRPFLLNTFFSSRHGLLSWTPVFWFCFIGLILLTKRNARRYGILWAPLVIMTYVNATTADWWGGGSFSSRRFDTLFPIFALGLCAFLHAATTFVRRNPSSALLPLVLGGALWNLTLARAVSRGEAPSNTPLSLKARALTSAQALSSDVGFPTTWPASWIFAARYRASPGSFDLISGKYLFHRQTNLGGLADIGGLGDERVVLDGFSAPRQDWTTTYRTFESTGRFAVSLAYVEDLEIRLRARTSFPGTALVRVLVNGVSVGSFAVGPTWGERSVETARTAWKREVNVVTLESSTPIDFDQAMFVRTAQ